MLPIQTIEFLHILKCKKSDSFQNCPALLKILTTLEYLSPNMTKPAKGPVRPADSDRPGLCCVIIR